MNRYRYILEPYGDGKNTRHVCPNCGRKKQFTLYIDTETGSHVHETVGSCNRQSKCGYHYTPKQYFAENTWLQQGQQTVATPLQQRSNAATVPFQHGWQRLGNSVQRGNSFPATRVNEEGQPVSFIPMEILKESRRCYGENNFVLFLRSKLGHEATEKLVALYHIGTSNKWPGATVFWQIDQQGKVRAGKVMLYNETTGKRVKKPFPHLTWVHKVLGLENFNLKQCLFGEHLLRQSPHRPVAIVESEKTAIICSYHLPNYIWLATGGINNLSYEKFLVLYRHNVTLFPDLNCFDDWKLRVKDWSCITQFQVSNILERIASEEQKIKGLDLADFLIERLLDSEREKTELMKNLKGE